MCADPFVGFEQALQENAAILVVSDDVAFGAQEVSAVRGGGIG